MYRNATNIDKYAVMFVAFLYICTNPFIYAAKFEPVKRTLMRLIPCRNQQHQQQDMHPSLWQSQSRTATKRTVHEHAV